MCFICLDYEDNLVQQAAIDPQISLRIKSVFVRWNVQGLSVHTFKYKSKMLTNSFRP
jgi:hypothetical protein